MHIAIALKLAKKINALEMLKQLLGCSRETSTYVLKTCWMISDCNQWVESNLI